MIAHSRPCCIRTIATAIALLALAGFHGPAQGQTAASGDAFLRKAKEAAGFDFTGTLARVCVVPPIRPIPDVAPSPAPDRASWYTEPAKVFDDLYFVGTKIHSAWALTTSDGIILIDTLYEYAVEEAIVSGLRKVGLDPANVKYVLISHAHLDHDGGARIMQRFGSKVVMMPQDWAMTERSVNQYPNGKPKHDIDAADGQAITLGGKSVRLVHTPGHTPGTLSFLFDVLDGGKPLTVAYSGGTAFNFQNDVAHFDTYIASQRKMAKAAADANAAILMSNHSEFDNAVTKIRMMASRKPGEPHPFEVGQAAIARYFVITDECAQLSRQKLIEQEKTPSP